jgi:hypothetical protein
MNLKGNYFQARVGNCGNGQICNKFADVGVGKNRGGNCCPWGNEEIGKGGNTGDLVTNLRTRYERFS